MLKVGILGATGMVGRQYVSLLSNHPWFKIEHLSASSKSANKTYGSVVDKKWHLSEPLHDSIKEMVVEESSNIDAANNCDFVFSALDSATAKELEHKYAQAGIPVVSNASAHRNDPDVPMIIPEINPHHVDIIPHQKKNNNWSGFIAVKPNCSIQSYMAPLHALQEFEPTKIIVTTMQAVSGAGACSIEEVDLQDNVIPYIAGEEEKSEREPMKIFGSIVDNAIVPAQSPSFSAHCNRVAVLDGHMASVSVQFQTKPTKEQIIQAWTSFTGEPQKLDLPSAPSQPIVYQEEQNRPQAKLDRDNQNGMAVTVGRLRDCNVFDYRFTGLSHNIIRGAAGGGILNAELLKARGYV